MKKSLEEIKVDLKKMIELIEKYNSIKNVADQVEFAAKSGYFDFQLDCFDHNAPEHVLAFLLKEWFDEEVIVKK